MRKMTLGAKLFCVGLVVAGIACTTALVFVVLM